MVFPVVMYGCESWTIKKAECQRIDAFELWYWKRLEKAMAPHSSTLAWEIPWTEKPGRLQFTGLLRVGHDWATSLSLFTFIHWSRKWQSTPVFLPGESQGREPGGLPSMGHRVGHNWRDLAAAAACCNHTFWETNSLRRTMQIVECSLLHWRAQGRVSS